MYLKIAPARITKEYLLSQNTQETYLEYYLGLKVRKGLFRSPLRKDNTPTCSFFRSKSEDIVFRDFSGQFSGDFIKVVMYKNSCCYQTALDIIAHDFGYRYKSDRIKNTKPIEKSITTFTDAGSSEIRVEVQPFSIKELEWWAQYGITEKILKKFKVFSCKTVFLNNTIYSVSSDKYPSYGYYRGKNTNDIELWRIYYPTKKKYRFISNWKAIMLQGDKQLPALGEVLVVTKSMKDVMCLNSFGIPAIAPNSENLFLNPAQLTKLSNRFKHIIMLYDNDIAGISSMQKFRKLYKGIKCVWLPRDKAKDISDFHKKYDREETTKIIIQAYRYLKINLPEQLAYAS